MAVVDQPNGIVGDIWKNGYRGPEANHVETSQAVCPLTANRRGHARRVRHSGQGKHAFDWAHEWIGWPDFLLPRDTQRAVTLIRDLHRRAADGQLVEVACGGGVGRTGTVLAGVPAGETVGWMRAN